MKTFNYLVRFCAFPLLIVVSSCAFPTGQKIDIASADRIMIGSTKKSDIIKMFGQPPIRNSGEGFDMWSYKYRVEKFTIPGGTTGFDTTMLDLTFNGDVVASCQITISTTSTFSNSTQDSHECGK